MPRERSIMLAKRPHLGRVKTRLVPPLAPVEALALHRAMLLDSIALLRSCGRGREIEIRFDGTPDDEPQLRAALVGLQVTLQGPGDLGRRLHRAFADSHRAGTASTVVIGADSPTLPPARIEAAFERLAAGDDAVMAPAADGGYVLLGLREPVATLFEGIDWGGPLVAAATRARAAAAGVVLAELEPWYDVDDAAALTRLRASLDASDPALAPATRRCIAALTRDLDAARNRVL